MARPAAAAASSFARCFVYGTLQRGFYNHHVLLGGARGGGGRGAAASRFIGRARTADPLPLFVDSYFIPYLVNLPTADAPATTALTPPITEDYHRVEGELWDVSLETLALLDKLEGVSASRYLRHLIEVELECNSNPTSTTTAAWTFLLPFPRPGLEDLSGRQFLSSYTLADHRARYVPPGPQRDSSRLQPWGGFE